MAKIVVALGGNALGNNPVEQKEAVLLPAKKIVDLIEKGHDVLVGHGNGPQVGMIYNAFASAKEVNPKSPVIPFAEAGGMSQGYIGYHMLTAFSNELKRRNIAKDALYILTETIVDKNDKAFLNPTKPVGPFYKTKEDAQNNNPGSVIIEDAGRGYRKVVPSPIPVDFIGINSIKNNFDMGSLLIVGGGGGIPTIIDNQGNYVGVDGVIDKDFALQSIANKVNADVFVILTAVDKVFVNYGKENQKALEIVDTKELNKYIDENQFAAGSMLPKVRAAMKFVENNKNGIAIIASLDKLEDAISGKTGTYIKY